ncbi:unnamed protein product (mitochondrion) [Plasmodiophora brassicae]|uniref:Uncharacterized protein n=1 Tax=Plasmodiophora brassicae TaxID=37360 RepID=A0A3P3YKY8_PLABS|nr:unnamed protein product [Plasmodiophora brassicae]
MEAAVVRGWHAIVGRLGDCDLQDSVCGALRSSRWASRSLVAEAVAGSDLVNADPAFALSVTNAGRAMSRARRAALVVDRPELFPLMHASLDDLPVFSVLMKRDLDGDILQVIVRLLEPLRTRTSLVALAAMRIVLKETDLPVLRWQSALIFELLRRQVQIRDHELERDAVQTLVAALVRLTPRRRPRGPDLDSTLDLVQDEVQYLALSGTRDENHCRRSCVFLEALATLLALSGTACATRLRRLLPCLFVFIEHQNRDACRAGIAALSMTVCVCWPRVSAHARKLFEGVARAWLRNAVHEAPCDRIAFDLVELLALLVDVAPSQVTPLLAEFASMEPIDDLVRRARTRSAHPSPPPLKSALLWDMQFIQCG